MTLFFSDRENSNIIQNNISFSNNIKTSSCLLKLVVIKADLYYEITLDL